MKPQHFGHIKDLTHDPRNARKHTPRNVGDIVSALQEVGAARSIVIDEDGVVLAGNATIDAAAEAGITKLQVVDVDGETVVAVRRTGLTPAQKTRLALFDNRAAEHAQWDTDVLLALADEGALVGMWTDDELASLKALQAPMDGQTAPDAVPDERATDIQPGDLFELGGHRIICGDCTDHEVVARAMAGQKAILCATDPPYGVDFAGAKYNPRAKQWAGIEGDKRTGQDLREWLGAGITLWLEHCRKDAAFYFWCAAMTEGAAAAAAITDAGLHIQSQIIWVKNALVLGQADYHWRHENCWYAFKKGAKHRWLGERDKTTVWEVKKVASADYEHPMQKPVELYATAIQNHTYPGELCFEPFSGSGTQILACEQLQRNCVAIEVYPPFVQVAIDRWEAFTGKTAVKAGEAVRT